MKNYTAFLHRYLFRVLLAAAIGYGPTAMGQIGIKGGLLTPYGDIGQYYKKTPSFEVFLFNADEENRYKIRFGYYYANLPIRIDTVPIYAIQYPAVIVLPGFLVNKTLIMQGVNSDFSYRVAHLGNLSLFAAAGLCISIGHIESVKQIETVYTETTNSDTWLGGFRLMASLEYKLSESFDLIADASYNKMVTTDYSADFTHTTLYFGINYRFIHED